MNDDSTCNIDTACHSLSNPKSQNERFKRMAIPFQSTKHFLSSLTKSIAIDDVPLSTLPSVSTTWSTHRMNDSFVLSLVVLTDLVAVPVYHNCYVSIQVKYTLLSSI